MARGEYRRVECFVCGKTVSEGKDSLRDKTRYVICSMECSYKAEATGNTSPPVDKPAGSA